MEEYKVIITTSGLGSRLGELTKFTNKSLIRIGDKPSLSYIIESYPINTQFIITLGHFGNHVEQFLKLCYPDYNFTFVQIDNYDGLGSSLGYSLSKCENLIDRPFIYHVSDSILTNYKPYVPNFNYVLSSEENNPSQYRTINFSNSNLKKINEKGEINFDSTYIGVCGIKDYEVFFNTLKKLLNQKKVDDISDVHVINQMLENQTFEVKVLPKNTWFDIGNTKSIMIAREYFKSQYEVLDKKDESIFFINNNVIKFFYNSKTVTDRVTRTNFLKNVTPNIIKSSQNFYMYKKVEGDLFSKTVNNEKFLKFLQWSDLNLWKSKPDNNFKKSCYNFYITKTKKRIEEYLKENEDPKIINGELVPNIDYLIEQLDVDSICEGLPSGFHGDFILDNIIETDTEFVLIDWRQNFDNNLEIGDCYYDLAKLNHNLIVNHDVINKNLYNPSNENCFIMINSKLKDCQKVLKNFVVEKKLDWEKVEILTSLIWLNMSPLHEYPLNNFLFNFGKYNLKKKLMNK